MHIPSYPKVHSLGSKWVADILDGTVLIQEKIDGSQFSWAWDEDGNFFARSKGRIQFDGYHVPDEMFKQAINHLLEVEPIPGIIFRGEVMNSTKHNTLQYERRPEGGIVLYDVEGSLVHPSSWYANQFGIEPVQNFGSFVSPSILTLQEILDESESMLGGKMEGIVIKNYNKPDPITHDKFMVAKLVSKEFQEKHQGDWKQRNPNRKDVTQLIIQELDTTARREKAVQYLRDHGQLEGTPRDIGAIIKRVQEDIWEEEQDYIAGRLAAHFKKEILGGVAKAIPTWYKDRLLDDA